MEQRTLGLTVISAKGLKDVKHIRSMHLYVSVTMSGGASQTITSDTPVDHEGGSDPVWNFAMKFIIDEKELLSNSLVLVFRIRCSRVVRGDKDVGDVHASVRDLLHKSNDSSNTTTLQVRVPFSGHQGELTFSYAFDQQPCTRGGQQPTQVPPGYTFMSSYSQTTATSASCVLTGEPPPLGQQVVFPQPMMTAASPVWPYPPPNPTVAPPIASDGPAVLGGIPGVDVDREKTEYELQLENTLAGLLKSIAAMDVEDGGNAAKPASSTT